jgi:hypothetical protein
MVSDDAFGSAPTPWDGGAAGGMAGDARRLTPLANSEAEANAIPDAAIGTGATGDNEVLPTIVPTAITIISYTPDTAARRTTGFMPLPPNVHRTGQHGEARLRRHCSTRAPDALPARYRGSGEAVHSGRPLCLMPQNVGLDRKAV